MTNKEKETKQKKRAMLSVDPELHQRMKVLSAKQSRSIYELTDESIVVYLTEHEAKDNG